MPAKSKAISSQISRVRGNIKAIFSENDRYFFHSCLYFRKKKGNFVCNASTLSKKT